MVERKPWYVRTQPHRHLSRQVLMTGLVAALLIAAAAAMDAPGLVLVAAGCAAGAVRVLMTNRWHREHHTGTSRPGS